MMNKITRVVTAFLIGTGVGILARPSIEKLIQKNQPDQVVKISEEKSRFSREEREAMFDNGIAIPFEIRHSSGDIENYRGDSPKNIQKMQYYLVCVNGQYNSQGSSIGSEEANFLLRTYGWNQ